MYQIDICVFVCADQTDNHVCVCLCVSAGDSEVAGPQRQLVPDGGGQDRAHWGRRAVDAGG